MEKKKKIRSKIFPPTRWSNRSASIARQRWTYDACALRMRIIFEPNAHCLARSNIVHCHTIRVGSTHIIVGLTIMTTNWLLLTHILQRKHKPSDIAWSVLIWTFRFPPKPKINNIIELTNNCFIIPVSNDRHSVLVNHLCLLLVRFYWISCWKCWK